MNTDDKRTPYVVTVRETLSRTVIIWADSQGEAEDTADNFCCVGDICLGDQDFIGRDIESDGIASDYDISTFENYERNE